MKKNLPSPNFDYTPSDPKFIAGIRPFREDSYRLEEEHLNDKLVIHNYGHGGAGITLSWGCALEVEDLIFRNNNYTKSTDVAIIGCGVMGLTIATRLLNLGHKVSIYTKDIPPHTTSNVAGGQWNPSTVAFQDIEQFHRVLRRSFKIFESQLGDEYGVSRKTNFTRSRNSSFELVPKDIIPEPKYYSRVPFEGHDNEGYSYETLLIEPPIFLHKLFNDIVKLTTTNRVKLIEKDFSDFQEILEVPERVIVNCTGYGAKKILDDEKMIPIKGQLALLKPQELPYLYGNGYIFPRRDYLILGGTFEEGNDDPTPDIETCKEIIEMHKKNFDLKHSNKSAYLKKLFRTDRIIKKN
ncbi:MAG: FAD-dependent oxidoreductase [Algibacter sp.]